MGPPTTYVVPPTPTTNSPKPTASRLRGRRSFRQVRKAACNALGRLGGGADDLAMALTDQEAIRVFFLNGNLGL